MIKQRFQPRFGDVTIRDRGRLPHWESEGATYFVTFRLGDSLPESVLVSYQFERDDILKTAQQQGREISPAERKRLDDLFSERVETYLDAGQGPAISPSLQSPTWWRAHCNSSRASVTSSSPGA